MKRPMETNNSGEVRVLFVRRRGSWGVRVRGEGVCVCVSGGGRGAGGYAGALLHMAYI
jgi:hypothetical protein